MSESGNGPKQGREVTIETNKGTIKFALYEEDAPITTANFVRAGREASSTMGSSSIAWSPDS